MSQAKVSHNRDKRNKGKRNRQFPKISRAKNSSRPNKQEKPKPSRNRFARSQPKCILQDEKANPLIVRVKIVPHAHTFKFFSNQDNVERIPSISSVRGIQPNLCCASLLSKQLRNASQIGRASCRERV